MINKWLVTGLCFLGVFASASVSAATQTISPSQAAFNVPPGGAVEFTVEYTASSPRDTTGLGVQLYYDSSKLTFTGVSDVFAKGNAGIIADANDVADGDGDASTDKIIPAAWFDLGSDWPGTVNPGDIVLYKVSFTANAGFISNTTINFTGDASGGHVFASTPVTVTALARPIPTLSEWGIILLSILLLLASWFGVGRNKQA